MRYVTEVVPPATAAKHVVRVDPQVWAVLKKNARAGETPNTVIRRLLELPEVNGARRSGALKPYTRRNGGKP